jgi:hypothetical protein
LVESILLELDGTLVDDRIASRAVWLNPTDLDRRLIGVGLAVGPADLHRHSNVLRLRQARVAHEDVFPTTGTCSVANACFLNADANIYGFVGKGLTELERDARLGSDGGADLALARNNGKDHESQGDDGPHRAIGRAFNGP